MSRPSTDEIAAVIVTYNSERFIRQCLESLIASSCVCEIIVVDNASTDNTVAVVNSMSSSVRVAKNPTNRGFGSAANLGASLSQRPILAFINPDAVVGTGTMEILLANLISSDRIIATGPALLNERGEREYSARSFPTVWHTHYNRRYHDLFPASRHPEVVRYLKLDSDRTSTFACDWLSGAFFLMRRNDFNKLGGFSEWYFMYYEDVDLFRRAANDRVTLFVGEAVAIHHIGGSSKHVSTRAAVWRVKAVATYYRRHLRRGVITDLQFLCSTTAGIIVEIAARLFPSLSDHQ